ncbi:MAG TPA: hypothetical protein VGF99_09425, partial [Myxococcota bacterium]
GAVIDGPTISMTARTYQRRSTAAIAIGAANATGSWTDTTTLSLGTPGSGQAAATFAGGCYISEVADAGTAQGGSDSEFLELHCVSQPPAP